MARQPAAYFIFTNQFPGFEQIPCPATEGKKERQKGYKRSSFKSLPITDASRIVCFSLAQGTVQIACVYSSLGYLLTYPWNLLGIGVLLLYLGSLVATLPTPGAYLLRARTPDIVLPTMMNFCTTTMRD